ncbi:hypothetical protein OH76DRAFT_187094 [Lentinus brumalis]|uniref:Uncharacterized protein n=1 Tax=Lentinus brumalis TaxID=2498619 RepID=A0A371CN56_9APHY|nr:hypothetical protein OH76DRAFT_187094 [Polyporus brumalis]
MLFADDVPVDRPRNVLHCKIFNAMPCFAQSISRLCQVTIRQTNAQARYHNLHKSPLFIVPYLGLNRDVHLLYFGGPRAASREMRKNCSHCTNGGQTDASLSSTQHSRRSSSRSVATRRVRMRLSTPLNIATATSNHRKPLHLKNVRQAIPPPVANGARPNTTSSSSVTTIPQAAHRARTTSSGARSRPACRTDAGRPCYPAGGARNACRPTTPPRRGSYSGTSWWGRSIGRSWGLRRHRGPLPWSYVLRVQ